MCDYSLMAIPNRLAVCGEELVIHRFESGAVAGLASPCDLRKRQEYRRVPSQGFWQRLKEFFDPPSAPAIPAVCIPPGTRLLVRDRDAVRFPNGFEVLLQRFAEGQRLRVLSLSAAEEQGSGRVEQHGVSMRVG